MPPGFSPPDFHAKLDPAEFVRSTPPTAMIRGAFITNLLTMARSAQRELSCVDPKKKYHAFKDYPLSEHVEILSEVARVVHPALMFGEALRQIGQRIYPLFASSLVGKVIFSTVGHSPPSLLSAGAKAYNVSASVGSVKTISLDDHHGHFFLDEMYNYVEQYHVGIMEGAIKVIGYEPQILTKPISRTSSEFYVTW
jgi:uncharacterized protein (TIGR02265 family)